EDAVRVLDIPDRSVTGAAGVEEQGPELLPGLLGRAPIEPDRDLRAVRLRPVDRDAQRAALEPGLLRTGLPFELGRGSRTRRGRGYTGREQTDERSSREQVLHVTPPV